MDVSEGYRAFRAGEVGLNVSEALCSTSLLRNTSKPASKIHLTPQKPAENYAKPPEKPPKAPETPSNLLLRQ